MRRSNLFVLAFVMLGAADAAAQSAVTATAEVVAAVSVSPAQVDVSASASGVLVSERAAPQRGSMMLEQTYVTGSRSVPMQRTVWVRDARGLHQEQLFGVSPDDTAAVSLRQGGLLRSVDVKLGSDQSVTVTRVVATNS